METTAQVGISFGTFALGLILGALLARRSRGLHFEWRLTLDADDRPADKHEPEPPEVPSC
jgi:hypothetical protein